MTTLGTDVDGAIRRLSTEYEVRGLPFSLSSVDDPAVSQGNIVNQVQFEYNPFGQLVTDYQSHDGAVNTSTTPKVQYAYADGSANTVRPTALVYPNGRTLTYGYGTSGGPDDRASRIHAIIDDDPGSTHLAEYEYLGLGTPVVIDYTEPQIRYTLVGTAGGDDPDTGDIYRGLDRFGRVKDSYWYNYDTSADVDRINYGYDRAGNHLWRENTVATALNKDFDELYAYDGLHRLKNMHRGRLNAQKTELTTTTFAQCWTLDETGNWRGFREDDVGDGTWDLVQQRTANKVNEITGISETTGPVWTDPAYDQAGNMTTIPRPADPTASYVAIYDAWRRLVSLSEDGNIIAEYSYDPRRYSAIMLPSSESETSRLHAS